MTVKCVTADKITADVTYAEGGMIVTDDPKCGWEHARKAYEIKKHPLPVIARKCTRGKRCRASVGDLFEIFIKSMWILYDF